MLSSLKALQESHKIEVDTLKAYVAHVDEELKSSQIKYESLICDHQNVTVEIVMLNGLYIMGEAAFQRLVDLIQDVSTPNLKDRVLTMLDQFINVASSTDPLIES